LFKGFFTFQNISRKLKIKQSNLEFYSKLLIELLFHMILRVTLISKSLHLYYSLKFKLLNLL